MACAATSDDPVGRHSAALLNPDGEDTTEPFLFPFVVQINSSSCTGTLISPSHVLTAAHCVNPSTPGFVSFAARVGDIAQENKFAVANCWQHDLYIDLNQSLIRSDVLPGLTAAQKAAALTTQCGVLRDSQFTLSSSVRADVAVLQLERPVPHARLDPSTISAGHIFVDPISLITTPPANGSTFTGTAVGYGETGGGTGSGTRWYKQITAVMGSQTISSSVLAPGDSGGPLLFATATGWEVLGVASTTGAWASLGDSATRAWIRSKLDLDRNGRVDTHCVRRSRVGSDPAANASNDQDGDGFLDTVDSCPGTYNPCQERADMDGDGVDDDCDACPTTALVAQPRGNHPGNADTDLDEVPDLCDCQPTVPNWLDTDHDYVRNECDNCVWDRNPFQENRDGDVFGDACDGCPDTVDSGFDLDMDGVPNRCDNCPDVENADQANCNVDAETATMDPATGLPYYYVCDPETDPECDPEQHVYGTGDACDPNPCGETAVVRSGDDYQVRVDALVADGGDVFARTGFRFCRCYGARGDSLEDRLTCRFAQPDPDETGQCAISDLEAYVYAFGEHERWREVTLEHLSVDSVPPVVDGSGRRAEVMASYTAPGPGFDLDANAHWYVATDVVRWRTNYGEIVPFGGGGIVPMRGVLWTHTPGQEAGADFDEETRRLASHYWSGGVAGPIPFDPRPPWPCMQFIGPFFDSGLCPLCGTAGPSPWLTAPLGVDCGFFPELPEAWPVIQFRENWLEWNELRDPEWEAPLAELPEFLGPEHPEWLETRWVAASDAHLAGAEQSLRYVRIHLEGATVVRTLLVDAEGLASGCGEEECPNIGEPPARGSFVATASARRNRFWIAGGDGFHDVWRHDLDTGVWMRLVDDERLGTILAITYDGVSDRLLVLTGAGAYVDLRDVAPDGTTTMLASWPRFGTMSTFGLAVDPRGNTYITSSNGEDYCAILLRSPEYEIDGVIQDAGYMLPDAAFGDLPGLTGLVYREGGFRTFEHSPGAFEAPDGLVFEQCM